MISFKTFENLFLFGYVEVICFESFEHPISLWFDEMICFEIPEYQFWSHFPDLPRMTLSIFLLMEILSWTPRISRPPKFFSKAILKNFLSPIGPPKVRWNNPEEAKVVPGSWRWLDWPVQLGISLLPSQQEPIQVENQIEGNSAIFNPITSLPKCFQLLNAKI